MNDLRTSIFPLFILISVALAFYSWALHSLTLEEDALIKKCASLETRLVQLEQDNLHLKEKLCHIQDPSGQEYMLRHYLGLCPRSALLIRFSGRNQ